MSSPTIGLLWGDFPWDSPPPKVGKLLSSGVVGRNLARALRDLGTLVPYAPSDDAGERDELAAFLRSIDVLWADLYPPSAAAVRLRHELDLPCRNLLYGGGTLPKAAEAMLFPWRHLLRPGDNLLFTCRADLEIWRRLVAWSRLSAWVLPLPVDETVFHPDDERDRDATRATYGLPADMPLLLYVGRLNMQKNLHTLLRLFADVRIQVPSAHLCLVGETDDIMLAEFGVPNTDYLQRLQTLASELGVGDAITFIEPTFGADLAALYRAADVVVNASFYHRENFGLSQAEAQASGVPVVCTDWGGFRDVVRHGETGYLMETIITRHGAVVDWASGVDYVVSLLQDESLRREMGQRAAQWAAEQFTIATFTSRLRRILEAPPIDVDECAGNAYEPSRFAERYEAHKRECGWYEPGPVRRPMFQGEMYQLYETMMAPYATRLARELQLSSVEPACIPYFPWDVEVGDGWASRLDWVWPLKRTVSQDEEASLLRVNGRTSVGQIAIDLDQPVDHLARTLHELYLDGFLLFGQKPLTV